MSRSADEQQVLALAAVMQAGVLADRLAQGYHAQAQTIEALTGSVLALDETDASRVFPDIEALGTGLQALERVFRAGQDRENARPVGYALGLIQLAHRLRRDTALTSILRNRLEALSAQQAHFGEPWEADFCHRLAGIYQDTLGTLRMRIRVQGQPEYLENPDTAARIRALFLGGIRAAFLWHGAGGRRLHLLTRRARLLRALQNLKSY
jgi:high frequency lysogenization protein